MALGLLALVVAGAALGAEHAPHRAPKTTLSLKAKVVRNRQILATGKVRPVPDRGKVILELRRDGAWHRLGQSPLVGHGSYSVRAVVPAGIDDPRLRAELLEGKKRRAVSPVRSLHLARPKSTPTSPQPPSTTAPPSTATPPATTEPPCTPAHTAAAPAATPAGPLAAGSLMATIDAYAALPNHLSGTANSAAAESQFTGALAAAGLKVCEQAFTFPRFTPTAVGLSVEGTTVPAAAIAPLLYSGATGPAGTTAPLFYIGETKNEEAVSFTKSQVEGKIVVAKIPYQTNSKALGLDPAIEAAVEDGAAGFVAVTLAVGDYPKWEDTNARRGTGTLPVLSVGKSSGEPVIAAAETEATATLTLAAETAGTSCDRDVWGELEGADPSRRVYVGVPVSSYTPSASEHGTGYAIVVGLARHYASLPKSQRPETLVFIGLGGHEIGWLGLQALLASPEGSYLKEADAYVHLGSALGAPEAKEEGGQRENRHLAVARQNRPPARQRKPAAGPRRDRRLQSRRGRSAGNAALDRERGRADERLRRRDPDRLLQRRQPLLPHRRRHAEHDQPIDPRTTGRRLPPRRRPDHRDPGREAEGRKHRSPPSTAPKSPPTAKPPSAPPPTRPSVPSAKRRTRSPKAASAAPPRPRSRPATEGSTAAEEGPVARHEAGRRVRAGRWRWPTLGCRDHPAKCRDQLRIQS